MLTGRGLGRVVGLVPIIAATFLLQHQARSLGREPASNRSRLAIELNVPTSFLQAVYGDYEGGHEAPFLCLVFKSDAKLLAEFRDQCKKHDIRVKLERTGAGAGGVSFREGKLYIYVPYWLDDKGFNGAVDKLLGLFPESVSDEERKQIKDWMIQTRLARRGYQYSPPSSELK